MYENAGSSKGWIFGYSQGTLAIGVALSRYESEMLEYFHKVVLMAPCIETEDPDNKTIPNQFGMSSVKDWSSFGVYAINGPTWQ